MTVTVTDEMCEIAAIARFAADDECSLNEAANLLLAGKYAEHRGDCTNEPMTCARCLYNDEMALNRAALEAALPLVVAGERAMRPMTTAPKDGTPVLLRLKQRIPANHNDVRQWDGLQFVGRCLGAPIEIGWQFAAPVGQGGFPDEWFAGWMPMPSAIRADTGGET